MTPSLRNTSPWLLLMSSSLLQASCMAPSPNAEEELSKRTGALNVADGASASSLENSSLPASAAVDGRRDTRWSSSFGDPQWLRVDLGEPQFIEHVVLDWEAAYSARYEIQLSNDGSSYWTVHTEFNSQAEVDTISVAQSARYVRMYSLQRGTPWGNSLWEFEVHVPDVPTDPDPDPGPDPGRVTVPAKIEAEQYARFFDTSSGNAGDAACSDSDVDAQLTTDPGGGCNIGWTDAGEWLEYDIHVPESGAYELSARLGATSAGRGVHFELDGSRVGSTLFAPSLGWQAFSTVSTTATLPAGDHALRLVFDSGMTNVNFLELSPASTVPDPGGDSECKRGIAYGGHSQADMQALSSSLSWWYNWDQRPDSQVAGVYSSLGMEYVPMIWGENHLGRAMADIPQSGMSTLLGFNEPNFYAQANMSPERAAALWPELEAIAQEKGIQRIASPAVNYCGGGCWDTDPVSYLDRFFAECNRLHADGCQVDIIAYHAYVCRLEWLTPKIESLYKYDRPIWLTEFACGDSSNITEQMQIDYMSAAVPWLESNPHVERYAWFSGRTSMVPHANLLGSSGALTRLGQAYVNLPQNSECER